MVLERLLQVCVLITGAWALSALGVLVGRSLAYGKPEIFSRSAGSAAAGVVYAFGPGMSPSAKESVREHLGVWFEGVGYHLGIFASIAMVALTAANVHPAEPALLILRFLFAIGALCGAILLIRRASAPVLQALSCPDDYVSNLLATALAALALAASFSPAARTAFLIEACVLFLYAPLGKIRHCFFFFTTRFFMGAHYGRRGAFPPSRAHRSPTRSQ